MGDSRSHHTAGAQRKFLRWLLTIVVIFVALAIPAIVFNEQRFDVAQELGLIPDAGVEQVAGSEAELLVVPIHVQLRSPRPQVRYHATAISHPSPNGRTLTSVDSGATVELPIADYDLVSANPEGSLVFFREGPQAVPGRSFTLDVPTFTLTELPAGQTFPDDNDYWRTSILDELAGECDGISPNAKYITCYGEPSAAVFVAGDYQLDVILYGQPKISLAVYRGLGFRPFVGWSANDSWLYFQNEKGIWRVEIREDMFPSSSAYGNL